MSSFLLLVGVLLSSDTVHAIDLAAYHGRRYANASYIGSASRASSTSTRLGDYIAAGLDGASASPSTIPLSSRSISTAARPLSTGFTSTASSFNDNWSNTSLPTNSSINNACWAQWDEYWSQTSAMTTMKTTYTTTEDGFSKTEWSIPVSTSIDIYTETFTEGIGNFASTTLTTTVTSAQPISSDYAFITLSDEYTETYTVDASATITTPPCQLPSYVAQCQSQWESWAAADPEADWKKPPCTQASLTGSLCSAARSGWLELQGPQEISGKVGLQFTHLVQNGSTASEASYYWPTSSLIAPGCSVGCQSCRVSGSHVQLLYWPPATSAPSNGSAIATRGYHNSSLIATTKKATGPVTAVMLGTTLTSPTVYISFDQLHASNSCGDLGSPLKNIIVPITNSATLSSLYGWGHYFGSMQTASFNFTDLYNTPVPDEIYNSQPRCASSADALTYSCLSLGTKGPKECSEPFSCPRTLSYQPVLDIPVEVRQLQPDWAECLGGLIGVYDPPTAIQAASEAASMSVPVWESSTAETTSVAGAVPTTAAAPLPSGGGVAPATQTAGAVQTMSAAASSSTSSEVGSPGPSVASQADGIDTDPSSSTNALDVLTAALSQIATSGSETASHSSRPDPAQAVGATLSAGGAAVTISGQIISLGSSAIIIDGTTAAFSQQDPAPASTPVAVIPLGSSSALTVQQGQPLVVGSSTLSQGGAAISIGSQIVSLASSGVVVDGTSVAFTQPANTPAAVITLGSSTITAQQGQPLVIGSSTLSAGNDPIVVGSQTISLEPSGIVVDGSSVRYTQSFHYEPTPAPAAVVTFGSNTLTVQRSQPLVLSGTTLSVGGAPVTIGGQTISIDSSGVVVDGNSAAFTTQTAAPIAIFTLGSQTITAHQGQPLTITPSNTALVSAAAVTFTAPDHATNIAVQSGSEIIVLNPSTTATLTSGQNAVIGSETLSFGSGGLIAGSFTLSMATPAVTAWTAPNGAAYTALAQGSNIVVAGASSTVTLVEGSAVTMGGETISALSNGGGFVVDGSRTIELPEQTSTAASLPAFTRLGSTTSSTSTKTATSIRGSGASATPESGGSPSVTTHTSGGTTFAWPPWEIWLGYIFTAYQILIVAI